MFKNYQNHFNHRVILYVIIVRNTEKQYKTDKYLLLFQY